MFVKICGITSEQDALLAVACGADAVGFVFAPSKRQVSPGRVAEIVRRLPPEILTVGVFRDELPERVVALVGRAGLQAAQLHGDETPVAVAAVKAEVRTVFKAVVAGSDAFTHAAAYGADAVLVDAPNPGSGRMFDWRLAEDAPAGVPLIMAGGLHPGNVADAIAKVEPWGVDVASGVERSPGVKDPVLVRDFIRNARAAFAVRGDAASVPVVEGDGDDGARTLYDWQEDASWR